MRTAKALPITGSVLSTVGWLALVLAIIGGLLAMHVIGGVHTLEPAPLAGTAATTTTLTMHTATPNHHGYSSALPTAHPVAATAAPAQQGDPMPCGGWTPDGHSSMDGHGTCVPSFGPDTLGVPPPGTIPWLHATTAFTSAPDPKSKGRVPDPPSLIQLSIIRT